MIDFGLSAMLQRRNFRAKTKAQRFRGDMRFLVCQARQNFTHQRKWLSCMSTIRCRRRAGRKAALPGPALHGHQFCSGSGALPRS